MAIITKRLNVETITKLNQVSFENKKDSITNKASVGSQELSPSKTAANKAMVNNEHPKHGIVSSPTNALYNGSVTTPANKKELSSKTNVSRDSSLTPTVGIDSVLSNTSASKENTHSVTLSSLQNSKLDKMIHAKLTIAKTSHPGLDISALTPIIKGNVMSDLNSHVGSTIMSKNNLMSTLTSCFHMGGLDISGLLDFLTNKSLLNWLDCSSIEKFAKGVIDKSGMMSAISGSVGKIGSSKVYDKIMLNKAITDSMPENERSVARVNTKGNIDNVMSNLSGTKKDATSSNYTYENITSGLDSYDPSWKTDSQGNTNYYRVKNNLFMGSIAVHKTENDFSMPTAPTNNVTTNSSSSLIMSILHKI